MRFGVHVHRAGGLGTALQAALALECETIQMFSRSPRSLRPSTLSGDEARAFADGLGAAGIAPLVIHTPYLLNLASPRDETWEASIQALSQDISMSRALGAQYLVFHPGSHLGSGEEAGIARIAAAIAAAWERASGQPANGRLATGPTLLLEMVSGAGTEIGKTFEQQREIMDRAPGVPLGVCLDTCHVFAAGYDVTTREGLERTLAALDGAVGMSRLAVVHANDSSGALGSCIDRHADIGAGFIGEDGFRTILGCAKLQGLPFILETPHESIADDARNLAAVRRIAREAVSW